MVDQFYLSFNVSLIERYLHFPLVQENNRALNKKQRSLCKCVYRAHDESQVWPMLNFYKLQTMKFHEINWFSQKLEI